MEVKNKNMILIIGGAVILILAIFVGIFFWQDVVTEQQNDRLSKNSSSSEIKKTPEPGNSPKFSDDKVSWRDGNDQDEFWVVNPTSEADLYVKIFYPENFTRGQEVNLLVLVPGGNSGSTSFIDSNKDLSPLTEAGFVVVVFDPDGRGQSQGEEDQNGYIQQDGLKAVIDFVAEDLSGVKVGKIGVVSFSFGLVMASGTLSRYPDLPVSFYIDWEGPVDRNDFAGCDSDHTGHLRGKVDCDDKVFFVEREAVNFLSQLKIPYQRLQSEKDHAQPDSLSAVRAINSAIAGGVPWVRLNDLAVNQSYSESNPPDMFSEVLDRQFMSKVAEFAKELFAL